MRASLFLVVLLVLSAQADSFREANEHLREGRYEQAFSLYQSYLEVRPDQPFALYNAGYASEQLGRKNQARELYQRALEHAPPETSVLVLANPAADKFLFRLKTIDLFRHRCLTRLAQTDSNGVELFQSALELAPPGELEAHLGLARRLATLKRPQEAAHYYQFYLENAIEATGIPSQLAVWGPDTVRAGGRDFLSLQYRVSPDRRITTIEGYDLGFSLPENSYGIEVDPEGIVRVHQLRTGLQVAVGQFRKSGKSKLLVGYRLVHPEVGEAWNELLKLEAGLAQFVLDSPFQGLQERTHQLEQARSGFYQQVRLAGLLFAREPQRASEFFRQASRSAPDLWAVKLNLAASLARLKRFPESIEVLKAAPKSRSARKMHIQALASSQQLNQALEILREAVADFPDDPYFPVAAAEVLADLGQESAALEMAQATSQRWPHLFAPYAVQVKVLGRTGQVKAQLELLETMATQGPEREWATNFLEAVRDRLR